MIEHFRRAAEPPVSASLELLVLERIKLRSVRMLGRRAFGVTTPQASLKRRFIDKAFFFKPAVAVE